MFAFNWLLDRVHGYRPSQPYVQGPQHAFQSTFQVEEEQEAFEEMSAAEASPPSGPSGAFHRGFIEVLGGL